MKKMVLSKAKYYAQKILNLEQQLKETQDKEKISLITSKIQDIVDEVCEHYEPTAMYKVDEQVYELEKKNQNKI